MCYMNVDIKNSVYYDHEFFIQLIGNKWVKILGKYVTKKWVQGNIMCVKNTSCQVMYFYTHPVFVYYFKKVCRLLTAHSSVCEMITQCL